MPNYYIALSYAILNPTISHPIAEKDNNLFIYIFTIYENIVTKIKSFATNFGKHVEKLISDVHNDCKWSGDILDALRDVCLITGEDYHKPPERTDHRWLSTYDCGVILLPMMTSLRILYYSFIPLKATGDKVGKDTYEDDYEKLLKEKDVDERGRAAIKEISKSMAKKNMTDDGVKLKEGIYGKL